MQDKKQYIKEIFKPIDNKIFQRQHVTAFFKNDLFSADLVDYQYFSKQNKGNNYLLTVVSIYMYIVPIQTYVIAYIKNIKTPNSSAVGFNATFKIPLQQGRATNAETGELTYFFNDITFRQKLHITDKTTSIDQIIISLYDRYNNLLTSDERDYSFSLEFCDYDSDSDSD